MVLDSLVVLRRNIPIALVDQRVDPPLRFIRFSCEVFVSHLYQDALVAPSLPEGRYEGIELVPGASDFISRT
jgi:hypothetical protein